MKDYDFSGKAVLVTGGTGALGREICHAFLRAGALLATTYVADSGIPELESKVGDLKKNILFIKKDLGNEKDVQALVSEVVTKYGRIDVLANVVGGYMAGKPSESSRVILVLASEDSRPINCAAVPVFGLA